MWLLTVWTQRNTQGIIRFLRNFISKSLLPWIERQCRWKGWLNSKKCFWKRQTGKLFNWKREHNSQRGWRASENTMPCRIVLGSWNVIKGHLAFVHPDLRAIKTQWLRCASHEPSLVRVVCPVFLHLSHHCILGEWNSYVSEKTYSVQYTREKMLLIDTREYKLQPQDITTYP